MSSASVATRLVSLDINILIKQQSGYNKERQDSAKVHEWPTYHSGAVQDGVEQFEHRLRGRRLLPDISLGQEILVGVWLDHQQARDRQVHHGHRVDDVRSSHPAKNKVPAQTGPQGPFLGSSCSSFRFVLKKTLTRPSTLSLILGVLRAKLTKCIWQTPAED